MSEVSAFASATARHEHGIAEAEEEGAREYSSEEFVELVMRTDPCPLSCVTGPFADRANVPAHSHRPIVRVAAQLLEFKRNVPGMIHRYSKLPACRVSLRSRRSL